MMWKANKGAIAKYIYIYMNWSLQIFRSSREYKVDPFKICLCGESLSFCPCRQWIIYLQTQNYKKEKKKGILSFLTVWEIVTNIFLSPFLFTEVLLQANQYMHKFTHSTSKYHLPSISYTHTTPFIPLSLSIFLF